MTKFRKLLALSAQELGLLMSALIMLPFVTLLLKWRGFGETEKFLARFARRDLGSAGQAEKVDRATRMVSTAAGLFKARCLEQASTLWWMLGLMGIDSTIRLGVYKSHEGVEAHAWVVHQNQVVIGDTSRLEDYAPILDVNRR